MHSCVMHAYIHTSMHARMHAYVHPCMHACMHTYIHPFMHACLHAYIHTYIHAYIRTSIHACIHRYMHTYIHSCMHAYIRTAIHAYIRTSMHACIHTDSHTDSHTYIHTYIHTCMHTYIHTCITYIYIHVPSHPSGVFPRGNSHGQCAVPDDVTSDVVKDVAAGLRHTCAVLSDGSLRCFGDNGAGQCEARAEPGRVGQKCTYVYKYVYIYIYIYMQPPPPPWTLVLLPFGDGKSRISKFIFSKFPIVGPQSVIIWSPESSIMSQYDTLCT